MDLPSFRTTIAVQENKDKNLLFTTWGGIGDQICAEPILRHAINNFKSGEQITLAAQNPELYSHLAFHDIYDLNKERPILDDYLIFDTNQNHEVASIDFEKKIHQINLPTQFIHSNLMHCVDFPSVMAMRRQLPIAEKEINLPTITPRDEVLAPLDADGFGFNNKVFIHAGKHWQSKTFPEAWWNDVLRKIIGEGLTPVLIGKELAEHEGTVAVDPTGCIDLRNKTTLLESIALLKKASVLICNDSSPLHMAASGSAFIGFISTAKHPELVTHWRKGQFGYRMKSLGKGGCWEVISSAPNRQETTNIHEIDQKLLESWLPSPLEVAQYAKDKTYEYHQAVR